MPFIDIRTDQEESNNQENVNQSVKEPLNETITQVAPLVPVGGEYAPPEGQENPIKPQSATDSAKVKAFKSYLTKLNMYKGNVNDDSIDVNLITALQMLEDFISESINNKAIIGMIWQSSLNRINPQTSPEDIESALKIIREKAINDTSLDTQSVIDFYKDAQAIMDSIDVENYPEDMPLAMKQNTTQEETKLETGDFADSQQIGKSIQEVPQKLSMDDRFIALMKLSLKK